MKIKNKFWLFVAASLFVVVALSTVLAYLFWQSLTPTEKNFITLFNKENFIYVFAGGVLLLACIGFGIDGLFHTYIIPIIKLTEDVTLLNEVNPSHRIKLEGSKEINQLVSAINECADRLQASQINIQQKIQLAKAEAEEEKNILATFLEELPEGVVICNADGRLILCNQQAKRFLSRERQIPSDNSADAGQQVNHMERFVGLGRSIFSIIDEHLIVHALDEIASKIDRGEPNVASYFVFVCQDEKLLRVEAVPIFNQQRESTGFLLILKDITQQIEIDSHINYLLESLNRGIRSSLGSIRSTIEAIIDYPEMSLHQLGQFRSIIHQESQQLNDLLNRTMSDYAFHIHSQWPLVQMPVMDLVQFLKNKAEEKINVAIELERTNGICLIKADSYSLVMALTFVLKKVTEAVGCQTYNCRVEKTGNFVNIDLMWEGDALKIETLRKWDHMMIAFGKEGFPLTLKEVVGHHKGELWSYSSAAPDSQSYLRLFLPVIEKPETIPLRDMTILPEGRPEFYDFDLFNQPGQTPELDNQRLTDLTYTVFDTETTGLDPRGGDEIIAIGGIRLVNGRLLRAEQFSQLVDPERLIPAESMEIHGISQEMVKGQPTIKSVLPIFHEFTKDSILVAHNAAFDMRMLQVKEKSTGVRFINPVLDTLLISYVVHPAQDNHNLKAIAERLGINIYGRHTALGDAIATGEIFLRFIPLLAKKGIYTLKETRIACQKTFYARKKY
jgi:DNA polymerase-3 subunit epsilon